MSQFTPNTVGGGRSTGGSMNVYTLLLFVAFIALVLACGYVVFRHHALFGSWNPFELKAAATAMISATSLLG